MIEATKLYESSVVPTMDMLEDLFVNNASFENIAAYTKRFNPIKTMRMERMEIRHSAILAWLLDPRETHGLGDYFLKAFLSETFRGQRTQKGPNALEISQCDLRDATVRREWKNIDIFIFSPRNGWAFIIENKLHSKEHGDQLTKYITSVAQSRLGLGIEPSIRGIFLTLNDEETKNNNYSPINYDAVCVILDRILSESALTLPEEVSSFLNHYLNVLKDATGMNLELKGMAKLARQLYAEHRKTLDFIIEHGASTDFAMAVRSLFGDEPEKFQEVQIGSQYFVFNNLTNDAVGFMPKSWSAALRNNQYTWAGCEKWWAGLPLIAWFRIESATEGTGGRLRLFAEIGPLSDFELRKELIENIQNLTKNSESKLRLQFQKNAASEGRRYSKFFKKNDEDVEDVTDPEAIQKAIQNLLKKFQPEFDAVADILPKFSERVLIKKS